MATTINAGRVRFVSRGTYNNSTQYYLFDLVDYNGSSYIAKENTLGNLPTNTQYWQLIAEKGNTGSTGATGNGISSITKTGTSGLVDTYTITYTNGNTTTFTITNGEDGEVTQTQFDKLKTQVTTLKEITSQMPQVSDSGEEVYLADTIKAPFTEFEVKGHSDQETTEGYNLLNIVNLTTTTRNGITLTKNNDGTITLNGTASSDANFRFAIDNIVATSDYKVQIYKKGGSFTNNYISIYLSGDSSFSNFDLLSMTSNDMTSMPLGNKTYTYAQIKLNTGVVCNNLVVGFQIVNDASITEFEKYTNGASPSPNWEQPIYSAGDNENIWNGEIERGAINGDGLDVDAINRVRNVGYYELNKGTYTLSYKGAEQSVVYIFNANKVKVNNPSWENGKSTFTLEENGYIKYALKQLDNREMNVNDVSNIKLEKGNKATPYSPYGMGSINEKITNADGTEEQDYSIFVQKPMMDNDYFDRENNEEVHTWQKIVLDGSSDEIWNKSNNYFYCTATKEHSPWLSNNWISSIPKLTEIKSTIGFRGWPKLVGGAFGLACAHGVRINLQNIDVSKGGTVEQLRAYLAENPITVYVKLKESAYEKLPFTQLQIDAFNEVDEAYSYKGGTYISSEDEVKPRLEVSALRDLNVLFNN